MTSAVLTNSQMWLRETFYNLYDLEMTIQKDKNAFVQILAVFGNR